MFHANSLLIFYNSKHQSMIFIVNLGMPVVWRTVLVITFPKITCTDTCACDFWSVNFKAEDFISLAGIMVDQASLTKKVIETFTATIWRIVVPLFSRENKCLHISVRTINNKKDSTKG